MAKINDGIEQNPGYGTSFNLDWYSSVSCICKLDLNPIPYAYEETSRALTGARRLLYPGRNIQVLDLTYVRQQVFGVIQSHS